MITGISEFGFSCPKMAVSWRTSVFSKNALPKPLFFYSVFLGGALLGQVVKKGKFRTPTTKRKKWLIIEKLIFWYFCVFLFFLFFVLVFCVFFGVFFFFLFCVFFLLVFCCFVFPFLASEWQKTCFPPKKAFFFVYFWSVFLCFFWPCTCSISRLLSLSLSLSLVLFFFSSLLSFFVCFLLVPSFFSLYLFFFSVLFAFVSWNHNIEIFNFKVFFINPMSVFGLLSCFSLSNPFFLSLFFFLVFSYVFLFNINVFGFKKTQVEKHHLLVKRGVATKRFFNNLCFEKCEKLSFFFWPFFGQNLGWCSESTVKIGISAHFQKQKKENDDHFPKLLSGPS